MSDLLLLGHVHEGAKTFMRTASLLPLMDAKRLQMEAKRSDSNFEKARDLIVCNSPACQGFLWLVHEQKMRHCIARGIASFCEDD